MAGAAPTCQEFALPSAKCAFCVNTGYGLKRFILYIWLFLCLIDFWLLEPANSTDFSAYGKNNAYQ